MHASLKVLGLWLGLILASCAPHQARIALPPEPVPVAPRAGTPLPIPLFYDEVQVRAFVRDEAGQRREVGNAACRLDTPAYTAAFNTPGRVIIPVYRVGSPVLDVTCRAGDRAGAARRSLLWRPAGAPPPYSWPRRWPGDPLYPYERRSGVWLGVELGDPGWGWGDPWWSRRSAPTYPNIEVDLR